MLRQMSIPKSSQFPPRPRHLPNHFRSHNRSLSQHYRSIAFMKRPLLRHRALSTYAASFAAGLYSSTRLYSRHCVNNQRHQHIKPLGPLLAVAEIVQPCRAQGDSRVAPRQVIRVAGAFCLMCCVRRGRCGGHGSVMVLR